MKPTYLFALYLFMNSMTSCEEKAEKKEALIHHQRLIDFDITQALTEEEFIKVTPEAYGKMNADEFNPLTDTVQYNNDTIYISYLYITNGCASYDGDINIGNDSVIYLRLNNQNEYVCTEIECDRIRFKIRNPKKKKYKIIRAQ